MKVKIFLALLAFAVAVFPMALLAADVPTPGGASKAAARAYAHLPLSFEPLDKPGLYVGRSSGYTVSIAPGETALIIPDKRTGESRTLKVALEGSNTAAQMEELEPLPGMTNYYLGADARNWRLGVRNFAKLSAKQVYPGVDVVYYGDQQRLEFDFVVAPDADPSPIALTFSGADKLYTADNGDLMAEIGGHAARFGKPVAYQRIGGQRLPVAVDYVLTSKTRARLRIGNYNKHEALVIDPVVSYATYLGGSLGDIATGIVVDGNGNAYITGQTSSVNFPSASLVTNISAFVTKLKADGSAVLFTTIINGNNTATGAAIAMDSVGGLYITGTTNSNSGLPLAVNSYNLGDSDAFIAELNPDGSLLRTAYLGGDGADSGYGITVDSGKNVIVVGQTCSSTDLVPEPTYTFPAYNGFQEKVEFCVAFVTKLDNALDIYHPTYSQFQRYNDPPAAPAPNGGTYYFSEFFGGQPTNFPFMGPWQPNHRYVFGDIVSVNITDPRTCAIIGTLAQVVLAPGTSGPQAPAGPDIPPVPPSTTPTPACAGSGWSQISKGQTDDSSIIWQNQGPPALLTVASTQANATALDLLGDVFVAGSSSSDFIGCATCGLQSYYVGAGAWALKVNGATGGRVNSTVLGTTKTDVANAIAVDQLGKAYVVGTSTGGIFTPTNKSTSFNSKPSGGLDAFIMRINLAAGAAIEYSGYLGGTGDDTGLGVAVDANLSAYITGSTKSTDFPLVNPLINPVSSPPNQPMNLLNGAEDAFVTKIVPDGSAVAFSTYLGGSAADYGNAITVHPNGTASEDMYVAGYTASADFPVYPSTVAQPAYGDYGDGFVAMIPGATLVNVAVWPGSLVFPSQVVNTLSSAQIVSLVNSGTTPISISNITVSGQFSEHNVDCPVGSGQLQPSTSCSIAVTFAPTSVGAQNGTLTITDTAVNSPQTVALSGTGSASGGAITASPSGLMFSAQLVNTASTAQIITVTNTGNAPVSVTSISVTPADYSQTNTCNSALAPGATCTVSVTFTPLASGTRSGTLTINYGSSTVPVALSGTGMQLSAGAITVSPSTLTFVAQLVGTTSPAHTITVTNTGNAPVTISSIVASPAQYQETDNCTSLVAGATCTISVTFTPATSGSLGGTVTISYGSNSPLTVTLNGTGNTSSGGGGAAPDFTLTPSAATVTAASGQTTPFTISIAPVGGFSQTVNLSCSVTAPLTCSITPASVTMNGSTAANVTVNVTVPAASGGGSTPPAPFRSDNRHGRPWQALLPFCIVGVALIGGRRRFWLLLVLVLLLALGMIGCGGGGGGGSSASSGTTAQAYQLTVTANYSGGTSHTTTVTVQTQ